MNGPAVMEAGAKLALYGDDRSFRKQFFGIMGELQVARVKAIGNAAGGGRPAGAVSEGAARLMAVRRPLRSCENTMSLAFSNRSR